MPKLSVLITAPWAERLGGAEAMLYTFLQHVDRDRIEPHVVLLSDGPLAEDLRGLAIRTTVIGAGRMRQVQLTVGAILRLARLIADDRPDVILNWTTKSHAYVAPAAVLARRWRRLIWWQHGVPNRDLLDLLSAALPAELIACSSAAVAAAQRRVSPWRRTVVVHPGIRPSEATSKSTVRPGSNLGPGTKLVGIIGRLHPMKGQDLFLQALSLLRLEGRDVHGLVVGGDAYALAPEFAQHIDGLIRDLGLEPHVTMTGHVADAASYIAALDALVCASTAEPFGIVLLEAMWASVPVVSTPGGGPSEIIEDGVSGVLVPERTADALAAGIARVLDAPAQAQAMGAAGRRRVEAEFTAQAMSANIERVLCDVAAKVRR